MIVHTMAELKFTGNCLRGSRPIVSFDKSFDDDTLPHLQLVKQLFAQVSETNELKQKPLTLFICLSLISLFLVIWNSKDASKE